MAAVKEKNGVSYLPELIRFKMRLRNISQEQMANALRLSEVTVFVNRERDPNKYTLGQLLTICKKLGIEITLSENGIECR